MSTTWSGFQRPELKVPEAKYPHNFGVWEATGNLGPCEWCGQDFLAVGRDCPKHPDIPKGVVPTMRMHLLYLSYVTRHKWYVFLECARRGLWWRGIKHDWSKFLPSEWIAYANYFYPQGVKLDRRKATVAGLPPDSGDLAFDFAWLLHQKRNRHHWQFFVSPQDDGGFKVLPMPEKDRTEMLCDWKGAGRAQGKPDTKAWYEKNRLNMQLHPETRAWVERELGVTPFQGAAGSSREA
jgi:hypothetical protein